MIFLAACAQINVLTGGPDDETAPVIDSAKTFPYNGQTNFSGDAVHIKFNEYIILVKPNDNIIITPRPTVAPTITSRNKTLDISFNEPLLENTTYTISFNRAISDLTEKNDSVFQYVFSTGNYIDSLSLSGIVTDGFTNKGAANFLIALYPESTEAEFDSVPYKFKPVYISQTNKEGRFLLNYLKEGNYYVYAIDDKNKNLLLDADEGVAFISEKSVLINNETESLVLKSFSQKTSASKIKRVNFSAPGKLELIFSNAADSFSISTSMDLLKEETGKEDSLVYWLSQKPTPKMRFAVELNGEQDTLKPLYKTSETEKPLNVFNNTLEGKILPEQYLEITVSEPINITGIEEEKIRIMNSDSTFSEAEFEIKNLRTIVVKNHSDKPLTLMIDSAAFTSIYGTINPKAYTIKFENLPASYYGSLVVNTDSVFTENCIVYLLDAKGVIVDTAMYEKQIKFENLPPGDYQLQLIIDTDKNGEWTSGSLKDARIPEKIIYFNELIAIKSKWEKEVDWILIGQR